MVTITTVEIHCKGETDIADHGVLRRLIEEINQNPNDSFNVMYQFVMTVSLVVEMENIQVINYFLFDFAKFIRETNVTLLQKISNSKKFFNHFSIISETKR